MWDKNLFILILYQTLALFCVVCLFGGWCFCLFIHNTVFFSVVALAPGKVVNIGEKSIFVGVDEVCLSGSA